MIKKFQQFETSINEWVEMNKIDKSKQINEWIEMNPLKIDNMVAKNIAYIPTLDKKFYVNLTTDFIEATEIDGKVFIKSTIDDKYKNNAKLISWLTEAMVFLNVDDNIVDEVVRFMSTTNESKVMNWKMFNESFFSTQDNYDLGPCPSDEEAIQVSQKDEYIPEMIAQCEKYKTMLEQRFQNCKDIYFSVKRNNHDFGEYYSVVVNFTIDTNGENEAIFVTNNLPDIWNDNKIFSKEEINEDIMDIIGENDEDNTIEKLEEVLKLYCSKFSNPDKAPLKNIFEKIINNIKENKDTTELRNELIFYKSNNKMIMSKTEELAVDIFINTSKYGEFTDDYNLSQMKIFSK